MHCAFIRNANLDKISLFALLKAIIRWKRLDLGMDQDWQCALNVISKFRKRLYLLKDE